LPEPHGDSTRGVPLVDLDTLLARADVVSLNLALNDERGIIDAKRIAR
jgi:phosphoglycerate dehydrogenase-like enzyme